MSQSSGLSEKNSLLIESEAYQYYVSWRSRFIIRLALAHIVLVLIFDLVAVYSAETMAHAIWPGSVFTIGMCSALLIVFSVIFFAFYYSYRVNQEYLLLQEKLADSIDKP